MIPCPPVVHSAATLRAWALWRAAHPAWKAAVVVAAFGCGGYVAGRALPPAPVPYVAPFYEPAPLLIPAPDVAYAPLPWGYEPGVVGPAFPAPRTAQGAPRQTPGPLADGAATSSDNCVGPCSIQPHTTDFFHSLPPSLDVAPLVPVPVPEPPGGLIFANAALWLIGMRARGLILAVAFSVTVWTGVFWAL